jgi:hypothetical protein
VTSRDHDTDRTSIQLLASQDSEHADSQQGGSEGGTSDRGKRLRCDQQAVELSGNSQADMALAFDSPNSLGPKASSSITENDALLFREPITSFGDLVDWNAHSSWNDDDVDCLGQVLQDSCSGMLMGPRVSGCRREQ